MHTGRAVLLPFALPVFCLPLLAVQIYYLNYKTNSVVPPPLCANMTGGGLLFYKHKNSLLQGEELHSRA